MIVKKGFIFELWRQDDNGNVIKVGEFSDRSEAERMLSVLSRNPHKQIYWITERPEVERSLDETH